MVNQKHNSDYIYKEPIGSLKLLVKSKSKKLTKIKVSAAIGIESNLLNLTTKVE